MKKTIITALVLLALIVAVFYFKKQSTNTTNNLATTTPQTATSTSDSEISTPGFDYVNATSSDPNLITPSITHDIVFGPTFNLQTKSDLMKQVSQTKDALRANNQNYDAWIDLANEASSAGDLTYAVEILNFLIARLPASALPHHNLGMLYGYYLKESKLATVELRKAIDLEPLITYWYIELYQYYRDTDLKDKAVSVLQEAVSKKVPNYQDLQKLIDLLK